MKVKKTKSIQQGVLLTFLKQTRSGKYAEIDKDSLNYPRSEIQREEVYCDEQYYYSIR